MNVTLVTSKADAGYAEAARMMGVCNACRYCEGLCAVFPAMERRIDFARDDLDYLANLCHNCGACFHACQYAPPHVFAVNVPRALAEVRLSSYEANAWPRPFAAAYRSHGLLVALLLAASLAGFLLLAVWLGGGELIRAHHGPGAFYAVFPHGLLVAVFGASFGAALLALAVGARRFWSSIEGTRPAADAPAAWPEALQSAATLTHLDGGGDGCNERNDRPTHVRRWMHHLTMYGFLLCFASTCTATLYHYGFGWQAPYGWTSLPVLLGTIGGIGLLVGPAGLLWLRAIRPAELADPRQGPMDTGLVVLLLLTSATGLLLLVLRATPAMPLVLIVHLAVVLALFLTLPYGKFVHGVYRAQALLKYARERRAPSPLALRES